MPSSVKLSLRDSVPAEIQADADARTCVMAEVAAGPAFVALRTQHFAPPVSFTEALAVLERYRESMRRGRIVLDDGTILVFDRTGFVRKH
jgi:hypothetical protein